MKLHICLSALLVAGCTARRLPPTPPPTNPTTFTEANRVADQAPQPVIPPSDGVLVPADTPDVQQALQTYVTTGKAPLINKKSAGFVQYPYGLSQPLVYCRPLELCDIELQSGEEILDLAAGDQERWVFQPLRSGPATRRTIHIMVKPTDLTQDMMTTVEIGTTLRTYRIRLVSRRNGAIVNARFYYPDEMVAHFNAEQQTAQAAAQSTVATLPFVNLEQMNDRYEIDGNTAWRPTWVANDGTRTYLRMPSDLHTTDAPVLFVETPGGDTALVSYRVKGGYYVVDKLFDRAVFTWGTGNDKQTVTISRSAK